MTLMTLQTTTAPTTAQMTMLRRWSVVCAIFEVSLEQGFSAMQWVTSVHKQRIDIGCECGCGGDMVFDQIQKSGHEWQLGTAMDFCRTH
jgi:hypothetical protein